MQFTLKDKQVQCIGNIVENKHTIGLLIIGYGKSMIYTLLPSVLDKFHSKSNDYYIILIVSPRQALMEECNKHLYIQQSIFPTHQSYQTITNYPLAYIFVHETY